MSSLRKTNARQSAAPPDHLLGAALRGLSEGVFIAERKLTADGLRIAFANEAFCHMIGYSEAELRGRGHAFLHLSDEDLHRLRRWHRNLARQDCLQGEGHLRHKNGETVYAAWTYSGLVDERKRIRHIVATYRNMTEKHRLQEALLHSQRLDAVGRLAGGVAHDFNNLISVINGYCEILSDTVSGNAKARKEIAEIHSAGQKAAGLVRHCSPSAGARPWSRKW